MIKVTAHRRPDNVLERLEISVTEPASLVNFRLLVNRALNTWDSAPQELKEFGDMLTHGCVTQDHKTLPTNTTQNTDRYSIKEQLIIQAYIAANGQAAWMEHIRSGAQNKVLTQQV